jgi:YD repeat-containing protein
LTYDERDLIHTKSYGNGQTTESFTYTPNGYLNTFTDGENKVYNYVHDSHGRLKDIIDPLGNKVSYGYDENSNLTTLDAFNSRGPSINLSYVYDPLNRLTHHKIQKGSGFITTQYGYNDAGSLNSITTPNQQPWSITPTGSGLAGTVTDPMGNVDTNTYDKRGWLKTITENESGPTGKELTNNIIHGT